MLVFYEAVIAMETGTAAYLTFGVSLNASVILNREAYHIDSSFMFHKLNRAHKTQNWV